MQEKGAREDPPSREGKKALFDVKVSTSTSTEEEEEEVGAAAGAGLAHLSDSSWRARRFKKEFRIYRIDDIDEKKGGGEFFLNVNVSEKILHAKAHFTSPRGAGLVSSLARARGEKSVSQQRGREEEEGAPPPLY